MTTDTGGAGVDETDRALARELERDPVSYTHLTLPTTPYV